MSLIQYSLASSKCTPVPKEVINGMFWRRGGGGVEGGRGGGGGCARLVSLNYPLIISALNFILNIIRASGTLLCTQLMQRVVSSKSCSELVVLKRN